MIKKVPGYKMWVCKNDEYNRNAFYQTHGGLFCFHELPLFSTNNNFTLNRDYIMSEYVLIGVCGEGVDYNNISDTGVPFLSLDFVDAVNKIWNEFYD